MAISRRALECKGCQTRIVTRTAIGHSTRQSHCFPCPQCGVTIFYDLTINFEEIAYEYCKSPTNAAWLDDESGATCAIMLDPEALVPVDFPIVTKLGVPALSPFIIMSMLHKDITVYKKDLSEQLTIINHRDNFDRITSFIERRNWDLLRAELKRLGISEDIDRASPSDLRFFSQRLLGIAQRALIKDKSENLKSATQLLQKAMKNSELATKTFFREYRDSKRLIGLWHQLAGARRDFLTHATLLLPVLQTKYWKSPPVSLLDCVLLNKQYEPLKGLYIDCFEILGRLSVVLLALHYLGEVGATSIPTKKGSIDIWSFEKLQNANKVNHLKSVERCAFLAPVLDTTLRNGIGHNQARYDASVDSVVICKQRGAVLDETHIPYTIFIDKVMDVVSLVLELQLVVFWVVEENEGCFA